LSSFNRISVFREGGIEKLSFEYIPSRLPHREKYIDRLTNFLRIAIDQPGIISERILITGPSGTGKTATAKRVGETLKRIAKNRGLDLIYAHVNCRTTSGKFGLVQAIIRQTAPTLPLRGYGSVELLHALWDYLNEHNKLLVLTLDEIDYFIKTTGEDIVYELTRLTDAVMNVPKRINFMFIARDHSFMDVMSAATLSKFRPQERFDFPPYKENQLTDILRERVNEAYNENTVNEEIIEFIASNTTKYGFGDARYALQLLLSAGLISEKEESQTVLPEHVREAQEATDPKLRDEDITMLLEEEKLILLALTRALKLEKEEVYLPLDDVENMYLLVCEEYTKKPAGRVLFQAFLKNLEAAGIIIIGKGFQLGLDGVKVEVLEKFLVNVLEQIQ
jgi:cell division control protein 6